MKITKQLIDIDNATKTTDGFMSAQDKRNLDNIIESGVIDVNGRKQFVEDVPEDNAYYIRRNGTWQILDINELIDNVEIKPNKPSILSPVNEAQDINQIPQITGSEYVSRFGLVMVSRRINISTDVNFENIVYESQENTNSVIWRISLKEDNSSYLLPNTTYYVRIAYMDKRGAWSDWSDTNSFTTMQTFTDNILLQPILIAPAQNGYINAINPTLFMSSPQVLQGIANFTKSDWQIATKDTFEPDSIVYEALNQTNSVTQHICNLNLTTSTTINFYCRARQGTDTDGYTPWTNIHEFSLRIDYNNPVFGIRKVFSKKFAQPLIHNIDEDGNYIELSKTYFDNHPLYQQTKVQVPVHDEVYADMVYFPPCWMKHNVYDNENNEMVIDIWYSPTYKEGDGWQLDPAFRKSPEGFYITENQVDGDGDKTYGQNANAMPLMTSNAEIDYFDSNTFNTINQLQNKCGQEWHIPTIYEYRLIMDLMLAEQLSVYEHGFLNNPTYRNLKNIIDYYYTQMYIDGYGFGIEYHDREVLFDWGNSKAYYRDPNIPVTDENPDANKVFICVKDIPGYGDNPDLMPYKRTLTNIHPILKYIYVHEPLMSSYKRFDVIFEGEVTPYNLVLRCDNTYISNQFIDDYFQNNSNSPKNVNVAITNSLMNYIYYHDPNTNERITSFYYVPTDIVRGYDEDFGFDLAILGIAYKFKMISNQSDTIDNIYNIKSRYTLTYPKGYSTSKMEDYYYYKWVNNYHSTNYLLLPAHSLTYTNNMTLYYNYPGINNGSPSTQNHSYDYWNTKLNGSYLCSDNYNSITRRYNSHISKWIAAPNIEEESQDPSNK